MHIYLGYICKAALTMKLGMFVCSVLFSPALLRLLDGLTAFGLILVLSCPFFFPGWLFCTRGLISVWVFEYCYLLFFKGILAHPWGYYSRNSYLCYSPAYRLLTGTKWKNPTHSVMCFVYMFYCPWFSATYYSISFFFPSICAYIAWQIMLFYLTFSFIFPINCQYLCPFNLINHF